MKVLLFFCLCCLELADAQRPTKPPKSVPYTLDCRLTKSGQEYAGLLNTTSSGRRCQAWTSDLPHTNYYKQTTNYPEGSATAAGNRCRNPDPNWNEGVWCYTTSRNVRWEHCNVRFCECVLSSDPSGIQYEGRINRARGGQLCQSWTSQSPNSHPYNDSVYFSDQTVSEASNYCRNPSASRPNGPWCYFNASLGWDYCLIPTCNLTAPILPTRPTTTPVTTTRPPPVTSTKASSEKISSSGTSITSVKITSSRAEVETSSTLGRKSTLPTPVPTVMSTTTKSTTTARPIPRTRSFAAAAASSSSAAEIGALRSEDENSSIHIVKIVVPVLGVASIVAILVVCVVWKRRGIFQKPWKRFSDWIDIPAPRPPEAAAQEAEEVTAPESSDSRRQTEGFDNPNFSRDQQPIQLAGATLDHSSTDSVILQDASAAYTTVIRPLRPSLA